MRDLASLLKASETPAAGAGDPATFGAIEKLRPHLSMLMGRSGFEALVARALVLAIAEVPWLTAVRVVADGELEGLALARPATNAAEFARGEVVLLAQLLGLLEAFIGPALTLRIVNPLWPQLSFDGADFSTAANDEEAK
ncbi:MAG: hypothetical protein KIS68_08615 [Bauldia sp.]|nr:hypothetical protein [Bauldia sp.]